MTFVGLDLHKRYITACALGYTGDVLAEVRRMPVSVEALSDFLSPFTDLVAVANGSDALLAVAQRSAR